MLFVCVAGVAQCVQRLEKDEQLSTTLYTSFQLDPAIQSLGLTYVAGVNCIFGS